jgi:hypothetical protein
MTSQGWVTSTVIDINLLSFILISEKFYCLIHVKFLVLMFNFSKLFLLEINFLELKENYMEILVVEIQIVYVLHANV